MCVILGSGCKDVSEEQYPLKEQNLAQPQLVERETLSSPEYHVHLQTGTRDSQRPCSSTDLLEGIPMGLNSSGTRAGPLIPR